jgi:hypothetical protein
MPCFNGISVHIHANGSPLPEHSLQKVARINRISAFVPVPPAKVPENSTTGIPEQSTFAISITLLSEGMPVPYDSDSETHHSGARRVGLGGGGLYTTRVAPFAPKTDDPTETVAAYIYFDGRAKEEVATLLRRGEETWVNSRWVSVPESEGGGLAEREFLFREVGLDRYLNSLNLLGEKKAKKAEGLREKTKKEKKNRRSKVKTEDDDDNMEALEEVVDRRLSITASEAEDAGNWSDSDSSEEPAAPEAAGQIKVVLVRVFASGEVKRGEYSPQFDAHEDDEDTGNKEDGMDEEDLSHTAAFAAPKMLDPETISTQTVSSIDTMESPYATFTFFYRGERKLFFSAIYATISEHRSICC